MVNVSIPIDFFNDCFVIFFTFLLYRRLNNEFTFKYLKNDVMPSIIGGVFCLLFDDIGYFIFIIFFITYSKSKFRKIKILNEKSDLLLLSLIIEVAVFQLCAYLSMKLISGVEVTRHLNLSKGDLMLVSSEFVNLIIIILILIVITKKESIITSTVVKIKTLKMERQIFYMLFSIFFAFEVILFIGNIERITAAIGGTILIVFLFIVFFMGWQMLNMIKIFSIRQKMANEAEQNKQLNEYLESVQAQYNELRRFKHDFKNIVLSMNVGSTEKTSKNYDELYQELIQQKEFTSDLDGKIISEYKRIANEPLRGLVIQKFFKAKSNGVKLNVEITDNYIQLDNDILNVVRIVGILLDNAIEETITGTNKNIDLAFIKNDDVIEISIENPLNHSVDVRDIFKQGYSTKGNGHGTGLANVSGLIDKDSNLYLDTEIINDKLRITLMILKGGQ